MQYNVPIIQPHPKAHYLAVTFQQRKFFVKTNSSQAFQYKRGLYLYSSHYTVIVKFGQTLILAALKKYTRVASHIFRRGQGSGVICHPSV